MAGFTAVVCVPPRYLTTFAYSPPAILVRAGNHPYPPPLRLAPRVGSANRTAIRAGAVRGSLDCLSARSVIPVQCETFPSVRDCPGLLHSCWRARESIEHVLVLTLELVVHIS